MTLGRKSHLSGESLLLMLSGELPDAEESAAHEHLASCDECRRQLEETRSVFGELRQAAERGDYRRFSSRLDSVNLRRDWYSRLLRYGLAAGSAAAAMTIGLLVWNSSVTPVSATELLDRAVQEQSKQTRRSTYVRFRDARGACAVSGETAPVVPVGSACDRIRTQLQSVNWDWQNPLSARGFERWRSSLADKRDTVTKENGSFNLRTSTSRGALRAAVMQVRTTDFHPTTMRLEFEASALIDISEESAPTLTASIAPELSSTKESPAVTPELPSANEPSPGPEERLDSAEIRARVALHEKEADFGYETVVRRTPDAVEVFGLVRGADRRAELAALLAAIPDVQANIKTYAEFRPGDDAPFPGGEQGNTLPPLAANWLKSTLPDLDRSASFVNQAVQLSSALLGEAAVLQELTTRCTALSGNPLNAELVRARQDHERRVSSLLASLKSSLQPLTGPLDSRPSITIEDARTLQSAIVRLLSASRPDAGSLQDEIGRIRSVFTGSK